MMQKLLTVAQVAEQLNVGERFVRRLIFERRVPFTKIGRHVRVDERDIEAFISAGRVDVGAAPSLRTLPSIVAPRRNAG